MTTYRRGQVVLVPFPFTDSDGRKKRPALVVSADWYNESRDVCILTAITSSVRELDRYDTELLIKGNELLSAGLLKESMVKAGLLFTMDHERIVKPLGRLSGAMVGRVLEQVLRVFSG